MRRLWCHSAWVKPRLRHARTSEGHLASVITRSLGGGAEVIRQRTRPPNRARARDQTTNE